MSSGYQKMHVGVSKRSAFSSRPSQTEKSLYYPVKKKSERERERGERVVQQNTNEPFTLPQRLVLLLYNTHTQTQSGTVRFCERDWVISTGL